ncbi:unnamed protein product [Oppiella nova]|uniref:Uncharacterized protein n=1 Tax=Oppiella nova TaxID=334625 RepID=A0A7R9MKA7_9ACAR|nr:unnamed protein product [Oppiella nova]CAG2177785.1 unnamed protein product [Oppiella nova]
MKTALLALAIMAALICAIEAQYYRRSVLIGRVRPLIRDYETHYNRHRQSNRGLADRLDRELRIIRELERDLRGASYNLDYWRYQAYEERLIRHEKRLKELLREKIQEEELDVDSRDDDNDDEY